MSFNAISGAEQNSYTKIKMATSTTVLMGQALAFTSGLARPAVAGDAEVRYISNENRTTTSNTPYINVLDVNKVTFEADTAGNTSQAIVGTKIDLTDGNTANQAATTTKIFMVEDLVGAASNKKVTGKFVLKDA